MSLGRSPMLEIFMVWLAPILVWACLPLVWFGFGQKLNHWWQENILTFIGMAFLWLCSLLWAYHLLT